MWLKGKAAFAPKPRASSSYAASFLGIEDEVNELVYVPSINRQPGDLVVVEAKLQLVRILHDERLRAESQPVGAQPHA